MTESGVVFRPPKPKQLTENETITSFAAWKSNIEYHLSLNNEFAPYLGSEWSKQSVANRGLQDDAADAASRKTAIQKNKILEHMLGLVGQYAPSLLQNDIVKKSTSLSWIWARIRKHYSFTKSEVNFLKLCNIKRLDNERYETFFQRIMSHLEDNLLTVAGGIQHDGAALTVDEEMSPSCERLGVYLWLTLIDIRLPQYVMRIYAHDLKSKSLKDLQPQLADSMDSMLEEVNAQENIQIHYSKSYSRQANRPKPTKKPFLAELSDKKFVEKQKECVLCKASGRNHVGHNIGSCWFLSKVDKLSIARSVNVELSEDDDATSGDHGSTDFIQCVQEEVVNHTLPAPTPQVIVQKVQCGVSPYFYAFYDHKPVHIIVDSGATSSMASKAFVMQAGLKIEPSSQSARGICKLPVDIEGEVSFSLSFGSLDLPIKALVVQNLDCDILSGIPFGIQNDVEVHLKSEEISVMGQRIPYGAKPQPTADIYRAEAVVLKNTQEKVILPGEYVEVHDDSLKMFEGEISVEPCVYAAKGSSWPQPHLSRVVQGSIRIPNLSSDTVLLKQAEPFAKIRRVITYDDISLNSSSSQINHIKEVDASVVSKVNDDTSLNSCLSQINHIKEVDTSAVSKINDTSKPGYVKIYDLGKPFHKSVILDPNNLCSEEERCLFREVNEAYDTVFDPDFDAYNDKSGAMRAHVNFGRILPPPRKGRLPFYNQPDFRKLQEEADKLEQLGVLAKPEDVGVHVQHVSPSFLVDKPSGGHRLVTAFNELSQYTRILPTASSSCDDVLRKISSWKYLVKTDLTKSFYQIRVTKSSMPYLGIVTPFKGLRVYTRSAMGMPGSSEHLQELISRVFGDMMQEGFVIVLHDDFYICGNTIRELIGNWKRVLHRMYENGLKLSAEKTVICPKQTVVLGWIWDSGTLSPSAHKLVPLANAVCPKTCTSMRSFIGAFKAVSRCIPRYASLVSPLEDAIKGLKGSQTIDWSKDLLQHFRDAQEALKFPRTLTIPQPSDKLIMTVDASPKNKGLGATLFIVRNRERKVSEFFSFKLKEYQQSWLPCEYEALAIATGIQHFAAYIRESNYPLVVYSDNKPCVDAYSNLCKGQFSASPRISSFLSTLSSYNVSVAHLKGENNQSSDFSSRNPIECVNKDCQICKFVSDVSTTVVYSVTVEDVLSGSVNMPYLNSSAWIAAQHDCSQLRRTYAHLTQGTRPGRKSRNLKDLRRYLQVATVNSNGLLIVKKMDPFLHQRELIIVPSFVLPGLLTALHLYLGHATSLQLQKVFSRYFYAIKSDVVIKNVTDSCNLCTSMKKVPKELFLQRSTVSPGKPGCFFFADVIRRTRQKILAVRDVHSSYTIASFIPDETADTLRCALLVDTAFLRNSTSTIHVDGAPGFLSLKEDRVLKMKGISLDYGRLKNVNKNSVADKAIQELELEILKIDPSGSAITEIQLQEALNVLNTRIRNRGLSSKEIIFQRDQNTGEQLNFKDAKLQSQQKAIRLKNHPHSSKSKACGSTVVSNSKFAAGDLVFIKSEGSKFKGRERYIVVNIANNLATLQKLNNGKFMSRRYSVPLHMLYTAIPTFNDGEEYHDWDIHSDKQEESEEEDFVSFMGPHSTTGGDNGDLEIEHEIRDGNEDSSTSENESTSQQPTRVSNRKRQEPKWLRSGDWVRD